MIPCDHVDLASLLLEDDRYADPCKESWEVSQHLESCQSCQRRLAQMAAEQQQWNELPQWLAPSIDSSDVETNRWNFGQPASRLTWTEAMAKSVLLPPSHPEMLGRLGRYEIERLIGSGGMGIVFKAYDTELNRPVAVKLLTPYLAEQHAARERFAREARAAAAVVDDHVVPIHNVEPKNDPPYFVMQYIAGGSLQQRLDREGPLEMAEILRIGMHTAKGLAAAHAQGLIHRDVKPSNILLDEGVERALLTDFGLARAEDDAGLTRSGFHPGTPHFMSPEQVRGENIDARSDLFSLGCVLYVLGTGRLPFRAETGFATMQRIIDEQPASMREANASVPLWLEAIVMRLLSKSPEQRFSSATEVALLLERSLAHVQNSAATPLPSFLVQLDAQPTVRLNLVKWIASGTLALAFVVAGVFLLLEGRKGTLTIESEAEQLPIQIRQGDQVVRKLTVGRDGTTFRLHAGQYTIEIDSPESNFRLADDTVLIQRGEVEVAKISYVPLDRTNDPPLTQRRPLAEAVREFNHLHSKDGKGRTQPPLSISEAIAGLFWAMGNNDLNDEVVTAIQPILHSQKRIVPAGWQFTGGLVRRSSEVGVIHLWEVKLDTRGLSPPIPIRLSAIEPPEEYRSPAPNRNDDPRSISLDDAIVQFNQTQLQRVGGEADSWWHRGVINRLREYPLTRDEVLAAMAHWQSDSASKNHDDQLATRLQEIAKTHQLPPGAQFQLVLSIENEIRQRFNVLSIRLLVPKSEESDSVGEILIRHQYIERDRRHAEAIHWGQPGDNGIQAGFRLIPSQQTYELDQIIEIEFLYRSVRQDAVASELQSPFRYQQARMGTEIQLFPTVDNQPDSANQSLDQMIGREPLVLKGHRLQLSLSKDTKPQPGVTIQAIVEPGKSYRLQFVVPNPGVDSGAESLETEGSHYFKTPSTKVTKVLPEYVGHWYRHWGHHLPGFREPKQSTPDPTFMDPFQIGVSLEKAPPARIPAYYAGGLQIAKVAPHSPAAAVGMEVGDILLAWHGHQFYGNDPSGDFLKYKLPNRELQETLERLEQSGQFGAMGSSNMKFVLLDHRSGEVIDIAPWFGRTAGGSYPKSQQVERAKKRKLLRAIGIE